NGERDMLPLSFTCFPARLYAETQARIAPVYSMASMSERIQKHPGLPDYDRADTVPLHSSGKQRPHDAILFCYITFIHLCCLCIPFSAGQRLPQFIETLPAC